MRPPLRAISTACTGASGAGVAVMITSAPLPPVSRRTCGHQIRLCGVDRGVRCEWLGHGQALGVDVGDEDSIGAVDACQAGMNAADRDRRR